MVGGGRGVRQCGKYLIFHIIIIKSVNVDKGVGGKSMF